MAGKVLTAVIQESDVHGVSTRSVDNLVQTRGCSDAICNLGVSH